MQNLFPNLSRITKQVFLIFFTLNFIKESFSLANVDVFFINLIFLKTQK